MGTDPSVVLPGTEVEVEADPGLSVTPSSTTVPAPGSRGYSSIRVLVRAPAGAEPGARLVVLAAAGESTCEREVLIVWHRASGWVKEIARKSEDQVTEAEFDPETGVVTVYEGRREFTAGAVGDTRGIQGGSDCRVCAASHARGRGGRERGVRVCSQTDPESQATRGAAVGPTEYAAAVHHEAQALRHTAHDKLMQAFLEPEVFEGAVAISRPPASRGTTQLSLID